MKLVLFILIFVALLFSSCDLLKYQHTPPNPSIEETNTIIVQKNIDSLLTSQLSSNYIPYSFSQLRTNKPVQFLRLDSIYLLRKNISKNNENYNSLLSIYNNDIRLLKKEINDKNIYHSFEMEQI